MTDRRPPDATPLPRDQYRCLLAVLRLHANGEVATTRRVHAGASGVPIDRVRIALAELAAAGLVTDTRPGAAPTWTPTVQIVPLRQPIGAPA